MGYASFSEVWIDPMVRHADIFFPMFIFWFILQFSLWKILPRALGKMWTRMTTAQQEDLVIRGVSIANGVLMSYSALLFLHSFIFKLHGVFPAEDKYFNYELPYYRFARMCIVSYFAWDVCVCFAYKWSIAWKVHGIFSFLGTYTLTFPICELYSGYYTGCFEMSNGFLHTSIILRLLADLCDPVKEKERADAYNAKAAIMEYCFGGLYFIIRVVGGTYVTGSWLINTARILIKNASRPAGSPPIVHSELALAIAVTAIVVVQILQYVWFVAIVKKALGMDKPAEAGVGAAKEKSAEESKSKKKD